MKYFIVEDRREGEIVLEGEVAADGSQVVTEQADEFEDEEIHIILEAIDQGVVAGHTSGVLAVRGLEWFEKTPS